MYQQGAMLAPIRPANAAALFLLILFIMLVPAGFQPTAEEDVSRLQKVSVVDSSQEEDQPPARQTIEQSPAVSLVQRF